MSSVESSVTRTNFDGVDDPAARNKAPPLCCSARLTYTLCAFFAMVVQLLLRNTLNYLILCMVQPVNHTEKSDLYPCPRKQETELLDWTRRQQFEIIGVFYYGYLVTLPLSGIFSDKFGGKIFFVHSVTAQAVVYMLIPVFARMSFYAGAAIRVIQGLIAGCGNPALYRLFSIWSHPHERTAFVTIAYGGFSVGAFIAFPVSTFLCEYGSWEIAFYVIGTISLLFGIACQFLVYSTLEDHPRLSRAEYNYLKINKHAKMSEGQTVPWKSIFTSVPVYAFIATHCFHTYGIMVFSLLIPRFFKEAMGFELESAGMASSAPFFGAILSKIITITACGPLERRPNRNLTRFRRIAYVLLTCGTAVFLLCIILCSCNQGVLVVLLTMCVGATTDIAFSGTYWPSMLYVAPPYAGLICGLGNSLATASGFLAPHFISFIVLNGTKEEWNLVVGSLIVSYTAGAIAFGLFGSSDLAPWGKVSKEGE